MRPQQIREHKSTPRGWKTDSNTNSHRFLCMPYLSQLLVSTSREKGLPTAGRNSNRIVASIGIFPPRPSPHSAASAHMAPKLLGTPKDWTVSPSANPCPLREVGGPEVAYRAEEPGRQESELDRTNTFKQRSITYEESEEACYEEGNIESPLSTDDIDENTPYESTSTESSIE